MFYVSNIKPSRVKLLKYSNTKIMIMLLQNKRNLRKNTLEHIFMENERIKNKKYSIITNEKYIKTVHNVTYKVWEDTSWFQENGNKHVSSHYF